MDLKGELRKGMRILGTDDRDYGAVDRYDEDYVYVGGRRLPYDAFERIDDDRVYLNESGVEAFGPPEASDRSVAADRLLGADRDRVTVRDEDRVRVPIAGERVRVDKRETELGEVRIHKTVETLEQVLREPLTREDVEIRRVKTSRQIERPEGTRQEGDWLVVPVIEEVLVTQKLLMVTEEIRIRKRTVTEEREIRETVRRERAEVEEAELRDPVRYASADLADADANPREARPGAMGRAAAQGDAWEQLREEIREGGDR